MKNCTIYKIHLQEELTIEDINLSLELENFEEYYEGKDYEEIGDRTDISFRVKYKGRKYKIEHTWYQPVTMCDPRSKIQDPK